jgi:hypothetical protein
MRAEYASLLLPALSHLWARVTKPIRMDSQVPYQKINQNFLQALQTLHISLLLEGKVVDA